MKRTTKLAVSLALDLMAMSVMQIAAQTQSTPTIPTFYARRDYPAASDGQVIVGDTNGENPRPSYQRKWNRCDVWERRWYFPARP